MQVRRNVSSIAPARPGVGNSTQLFRGRYESFWNFWKHGVTASFLDLWLRCREQARLQFVEGYDSKKNPLAIEFGQCGHWALEKSYLHPHFIPEKQSPYEMWTDEVVQYYDAHWRSTVEAPTVKQLEQQELVYGLAEAVLPAYFLRWDGDFTGEYTYGSNVVRPAEWVSLEQNFLVKHKFRDGLEVPLRGKRDGIFRDEKGKLWLFDTKFRSVVKEDDTVETLPGDLQMMMYLYAMLLEGMEPTGVILNVVRRPGHRQGKKETFRGFLDRVAAEVGKPANYDHYFMRFEMVITIPEIEFWVKNVFEPMIYDVRRWWEGTAPHYMNPTSRTDKYGRARMFDVLVNNDYTNVYRRKAIFPELEAA